MRAPEPRRRDAAFKLCADGFKLEGITPGKFKDIGLKGPGRGSPRKPIAHGTYRGSRQHRYRKEPLCEACHAAEAEYPRARPKIKPRARKAPAPKVYLTEEGWQARRAAREAGLP